MFRNGLVTPTSGWCDGFAQANLIVVPRNWAFDVLLFAQRNPKPRPVLGVLEAGEVTGPLLDGGDVRTDVPLYTVYEHGEAAGTRTDLLEVWREDLVTFALGCSFTFESALQEAGIAVAHADQGVNVPVFWACGVTPQAAVLASGAPFALGHAPGHMLVTDVPNWQYQVP